MRFERILNFRYLAKSRAGPASLDFSLLEWLICPKTTFLASVRTPSYTPGTEI